MVKARAAVVGTVDDGEDDDDAVGVSSREDVGPFSGLALCSLFPPNTNNGVVSELT